MNLSRTLQVVAMAASFDGSGSIRSRIKNPGVEAFVLIGVLARVFAPTDEMTLCRSLVSMSFRKAVVKAETCLEDREIIAVVPRARVASSRPEPVLVLLLCSRSAQYSRSTGPRSYVLRIRS
jgi:hypothetical protein